MPRIRYPEIWVGMRTYGLSYMTAYYRAVRGIPMDRELRRNGAGGQAGNRHMQKEVGQPASCLIRQAPTGRPVGCYLYHPYYGGCEHYEQCLDYASRHDWGGWKIIEQGGMRK